MNQQKQEWLIIITRNSHPLNPNELKEIIQIIPIPNLSKKSDWEKLALNSTGYLNHFYIRATNSKEAKEITKKRLQHSVMCFNQS